MKTILSTGLTLLAAMIIGCGKGEAPNPSGSLEATEVDIVSTLPLRIVSVRADLGDRVRARDTLIVLDTELLRLQRAQAQTNDKSIRAQSQVLTAQEGQAQTSLQLAESTLCRTRALLEQGSTTQQQFDEAQAKRDVADAQVAMVRYQLAALRTELDKVAASLAVFDRQIKEGVLAAPINGTVLLRNAEPEEMASPGAALLRLADLSMLELRVFLSETDVGRVKIGQQLPVMVDAFRGEPFSATVEWISSEAEFTPKNAQTRDARTQLVYAVKLRVSNADNRLHIGMPAEAKLP